MATNKTINLKLPLRSQVEMKQLQSAGVGSVYKQAELLCLEEEELLWDKKKILGDHSADTLLNIYYRCSLMDSILHCAVEVSTDNFAIILARLNFVSLEMNDHSSDTEKT